MTFLLTGIFMRPYFQTDLGKVYLGDCLEVMRTFPDKSVHCGVTSPPYWGLRSYLPDRVVLKKNAPEWVLKELKSKGIFPID